MVVYRTLCIALKLAALVLLPGPVSANEAPVLDAEEFQRRLAICLASEDWLRDTCLATLNAFETEGDTSADDTLTADAAIGAGAELHVIGIYEPQEFKTADGQVRRGEVPIHVDRPGQSIVLVLAAYEPTRWLVTTSAGTDVQRIIIGGHGVARSEALLNDGDTSFERVELPTAYKMQGMRFQPFHKAARDLIGAPRADSFQGQYRAPPEGFTITAAPGVPTAEEVRKKLYATARDRATLPEAMQAVLSGAAPLPARDWQFDGEGFAGLDAGGRPVRYNAPLDVPEISWPVDVAYDPETERLWGVTLGGRGYLYEYDIKEEKWLAWSMENVDAGGLIFDASTGRLISTPGRHGAPAFQIMDRRANVISTVGVRPEDFPGLLDTYDPGNGPSPSLAPLAIVEDENLSAPSTGTPA